MSVGSTLVFVYVFVNAVVMSNEANYCFVRWLVAVGSV